MPTVTVFLAGAECPFTCVFCDLWRYTVDGPTPSGAIARQLEGALRELAPEQIRGRIKLYNASNFFDERAVPSADLEAVARLVEPFERVVVECHARLVDAACFRFAERLDGRLEVALGLEVADSATLRRLNKGMDLADFDRAVGDLTSRGVSWRAFVLVGAPYLSESKEVSWEQYSVAYALDRGAERVTLIPTRKGNGALDHLEARDVWRPPTLEDCERAFEDSLALGPVELDLWDLERLAECGACLPLRQQRLETMNLTGQIPPEVRCDACGT